MNPIGSKAILDGRVQPGFKRERERERENTGFSTAHYRGVPCPSIKRK